MKKLFYLIFIVALLGSCGGTEEPSGGNGDASGDGSTEKEESDKGDELSPEDVAVLNSNLLNGAKKGDVKAVKEALDAGADVNVVGGTKEGLTALHTAVFWGHIEVVKLLLDTKGIKVNAVNNSQTTALMIAASGDDLEIVKLLLEKGGDKSARSADGKTAYDYASQAGRNPEIIKLVRRSDAFGP